MGRLSGTARQLALDVVPEGGASGLRDYTPAERVRAELEVLGLDVTAHVVSFYAPLLDALGVTSAVDLVSRRDGERVRVAGAKVAAQTPPVRSGQRVLFLTVDDPTGVADASFFERVHDRCLPVVLGAWLLVVDGVVRRTGARGVSVTADAAYDLRVLADAARAGRLRPTPPDRPIAVDGTGGASGPGAGRGHLGSRPHRPRPSCPAPRRDLWHVSAGAASAWAGDGRGRT